MDKKLNWLERHLNWTWLIALLFLCSIISFIVPDYKYGISTGRTYAIMWLMLIPCGWILRRKGQSLWWLILTLFLTWLPLVMTNNNTPNKIKAEEN